MKNAFEAEGPIREVDPLAALVTCWRERASGTLRFTRGAAECGFDLEEGEAVAVVSSDPRFETTAILVRAGKLAADAVERLAPQGGDPALAAMQTGLLTRREWKWGEKIRAIEVLSDLLSWNDGSYRFDATARPRGGDFRLPIPRLLLELFLRSRDRNLIDHQLGPPEQTLARGERFDAEFPSFGLTADAESVVRLIDGSTTAAEIAEKAPAEEFAVRKLLAALVTLGLVHPLPAVPAPAGPLPERDSGPDLSFGALGPRETEDFTAPPPSPSEEVFDPDVPVLAEEPPPEREMLDLPVEAGRTVERFEPDPPAGGWEAEEAEAAPESAAAQRWESAPEALPSEPVGEDPARGPRGGAALVWSLGILLAAVAAIVFYRSRATAPTVAANPVRATPIPAVTFPPPATAARVEPTAERAARAAAVPTSLPTLARAPEPTAAPTQPARAVRAPAERAPAPAAQVPAAPSEDSREGWVRRAERDRRRLDADRRTHYAIQLELVCEVPSLAEAWRHDRGQAMWLLSVSHEGRDCFRVFWGRYPTLEAAKKAKTGVPSYFVTARNHPAVVSVR